MQLCSLHCIYPAFIVLNAEYIVYIFFLRCRFQLIKLFYLNLLEYLCYILIYNLEK